MKINLDKTEEQVLMNLKGEKISRLKNIKSKIKVLELEMEYVQQMINVLGKIING